MLSPMMANELDWDDSQPSTALIKYLHFLVQLLLNTRVYERRCLTSAQYSGQTTRSNSLH